MPGLPGDAGFLYLQEVVGLVPCPMCIVQRYALVLIAICAGLTGLAIEKVHTLPEQPCDGCWRWLGLYVAARQSWLQWYPRGGLPAGAICTA